MWNQVVNQLISERLKSIKKQVDQVTIYNKSDLQTSFQFMNDQGNIFSISPVQGIIKPKQNSRIIISFKPNHTICYYERVYLYTNIYLFFIGFCIVRNHRLFHIDLIGTCYDLLIKPIPLQQKHIDAFRKRVIQGKLSEIDFKYMENAFLLKQKNMMNQNNIELEEEIHENANQVVLHKEMFLPCNSKQKLIYLNEEFLDFGFCQFMQESAPFQVELTNKLQCKITVFWTIQKKQNINNELLPVFIVKPQTISIKANSTQVFEISFRPIKNSYYYFQNLQFFAFKYNSKITKLLIEDIKKNNNPSKTFTSSFRENLKLTNTLNQNTNNENILNQNETIPPYSSSIKCVGHSFGLNCQPFIPILQFNPSNKITFNACSLQESLYQTVELSNLSDTPTFFKFLPDLSKSYRIFPNVGIIQAKSFIILTIEFIPSEYKAYNNTLSCYLNHNASNILNLHLHGFCSKPKLSLQNEGKIYFPPSYTGVYSRQKVKIDNLSRITLEYKIYVPPKYSQELYLEPSEGKIKPNEHIFIDCSFIPYKKKNYRIKVPIQILEILDFSQNLIGYHLPNSGNPQYPLKMRNPMEVSYNFEVFGAGGDGSLSIQPEKMEFDVVKVGFTDKKYATLHNFSNCTFYVELKLRREDNQDDNFLEQNFELDFKQGIIAANSKVDVGIIFNPTKVGDYNLVLDVIAQEKTQRELQVPLIGNSLAKNVLQIYTQRVLILN
ncbi:hypothetical protein IMG5_144000 [Ichthyophthirius multifiliis]|uniref:MSP domain-containing protein n=1 Tax=Ichthyophthirius multifiliis TaxID=5932 RepID=G0QXM5_ICHMU|nr:hypothetical protein IMG5_144000 [Ichthyophthirius multifiliis]EGR30025.1 hypothetical protein IMG5_144000 [Ichthyophthirius multifiliis]|eukprot:XP_004031261.1 hypothetical protein IMG5_144000 [Ichthyophthirius multifiliis]